MIEYFMFSIEQQTIVSLSPSEQLQQYVAIKLKSVSAEHIYVYAIEDNLSNFELFTEEKTVGELTTFFGHRKQQGFLRLIKDLGKRS
jgi:hypothetical protein